MSGAGFISPMLTGVGLFFCGVRFIAANLTPLAGPAARRLFRGAVRTSWTAALAGVIAGLVSQSTSAVTLVVVGLVRAGIVPETRAVLLPVWSQVGAAALVIIVSLQTGPAVACALERCRLTSDGQFPDDLQTLMPNFAAHLPNDVITGEPFKYHRTGDNQFVLYSVGWNETDDGGVASKPMFNDAEGDWVW